MDEQRHFRLNEEKTAEAMGRTAAEEATRLLEHYTKNLGKRALAVFAAAPSQDTFLRALAERKGRVAWEHVTAFHLDEYHSLPSDHPNTFKAYLSEHIFSHIPIPQENVHFIKDAPEATENVAGWYGDLFANALGELRSEGGLYVAFLGVGVNGHIAFNEPNTNLEAAAPFLPIQLDRTSLQQQYDDYKDHPNPKARYNSVDEVPRDAVSISVSAILEADSLFCMVPGNQKANAIKAMIDGPITDEVPASLLRTHHDAAVYVDAESAQLLRRKPVSTLAGGSA